MPTGKNDGATGAGSELRVEPLTLEFVDQAAAVISEAFRAEPITGRMFRLDDPETRQRHRRAAMYQMRKAVEAGEPPLVAVEHGRVVGVAMVSTLGWRTMLRTARSWLPLLPRLQRGAWRLGPAARPSRRVPRPYMLLDALGVAPDAEGRGIGGALLESVSSRCNADEDCRGVYLQTASARARHVYERAGFELVEERRGAGLTIAHLFKPAEDAAALGRIDYINSTR
jgi:GNAT superfamily N-acetyltransferase